MFYTFVFDLTPRFMPMHSDCCLLRPGEGSAPGQHLAFWLPLGSFWPCFFIFFSFFPVLLGLGKNNTIIIMVIIMARHATSEWIIKYLYTTTVSLKKPNATVLRIAGIHLRPRCLACKPPCGEQRTDETIRRARYGNIKGKALKSRGGGGVGEVVGWAGGKKRVRTLEFMNPALMEAHYSEVLQAKSSCSLASLLPRSPARWLAGCRSL